MGERLQKTMNFGVPNAQTGCKFYYGKMGETTVNQENFWKRATKREWKIKGAKERGYAEEIDQRKIDQMQQFLHHRGASRGSSRVRDDEDRPLSQESRATMQTGLTNVTRGTGWDSRASNSSVSSKLLKELLASNLALKQEFGVLKTEMMRTTNRLAQMEPGDGRESRRASSRLSTGRTKTPMLPK